MANFENYVRVSVLFLLFCFVVSLFSAIVEAGNFYDNSDLIWGGNHAKILEQGRLLSLSLDKASGSAFQSKSEYLFGRFDMKIKLVSGNSAGTVTAYYLSSQGPNHDEIDFEFLGNLSGQPYIVHTNVYTQGRGNREQQFYLWFDPTKDFHTYTIVWNPQNIIFLVDDIPIRVFRNYEGRGIPFPNKQAMRLYSSLWSAEQWATRGGLVKTNWSCAPFTSYYRDFNANAYVLSKSNGLSSCASCMGSLNGNAWLPQGLNQNARKRLRWVQRHYMIYNYCKDLKRFPQGRPRECRLSSF